MTSPVPSNSLGSGSTYQNYNSGSDPAPGKIATLYQTNNLMSIPTYNNAQVAKVQVL
jgi:hypothetical protein